MSLVASGYGSDSDSPSEDEGVPQQIISPPKVEAQKERKQIVLEAMPEAEKPISKPVPKKSMSFAAMLPPPRKTAATTTSAPRKPTAPLVPRSLGVKLSLPDPVAQTSKDSTISTSTSLGKRKAIPEDEIEEVKETFLPISSFHIPANAVSKASSSLVETNLEMQDSATGASTHTHVDAAATVAAPDVEDPKEEVPEESDLPPEELLDDDAIAVLLGRRRRKDGPFPNAIRTITQEDQAADRERLLQKAPATGGGSVQMMGAPTAPWRASDQQRRTGNLKGLAARSEAMESELSARWAAGKRAKKEARTRYGW